MSPPPAIENALEAAIASPKTFVPPSNWSNSKTPTGPFQTIVPAVFIISASSFAEFGPISKIISPSSTAFEFLVSAGVLSLNSLPQTTSLGTGISQVSINFLAVGMRSCSHKDLPTLCP